MFTSDEQHAFIIGFSETLCPWKPHYHNRVPVPSPLKGEYHYYTAGRALGFISLLLILSGIAKLTKVLLL